MEEIGEGRKEYEISLKSSVFLVCYCLLVVLY